MFSSQQFRLPKRAGGDKNFFEAERIAAQFHRAQGAQFLEELIAVAIRQNFDLSACVANIECPGQVKGRRRLRKTGADFPESVSGIVSRHGEQFAALVDNRELVYE